MKKALLAFAVFAVVGCGSDSTGVAASAEGTWNLQTVNGSGLPFTAAFIANPVYRLEILSDQFVVHADGTYSESFTTRETNGTTVTTTTDTDNGTWVQNNAALTITASDGTVSSAAISGNTITVDQSGAVLVYRRE
jgi:hypothetical protein